MSVWEDCDVVPVFIYVYILCCIVMGYGRLPVWGQVDLLCFSLIQLKPQPLAFSCHGTILSDTSFRFANQSNLVNLNFLWTYGLARRQQTRTRFFVVPHFLGVFLHTRPSGLIQPDAFFLRKSTNGFYPSLFGTEVSRPKSATTTREFSPAILGVWKPLNQPHFPKNIQTCIAIRLPQPALAVRQLLKVRPEFLTEVFPWINLEKQSTDEHFAGGFRMANGTPPAGICELMRALQNSDNAVRSEAEKTLMDAIKGAAVGWISMRFPCWFGIFCWKRYDWLSLELVGWVEDLSRRPKVIM